MDPMFPELSGIGKERKVTVRDRNTLEYLLKAREYISNNLVTSKNYLELYGKLKNKLLKEIEFNEDDLRSFIFATMSNGYDPRSYYRYGAYTGLLLHLLTERNQEKGKRTRFHINGQGGRYDYLFHQAREVDELIVENFEGDYICREIAHSGKANSVILLNNYGNATASEVGKHGEVDLVMVMNNHGSHAASHIGSYRGKVGFIIEANNTGDFSLQNVADCKGTVEYVLIANSKGNYTGFRLASAEGKADLVMVINHEGSDCLADAAYREMDEDDSVIYSWGHIKKVVIHGVVGNRFADTDHPMNITRANETHETYGEMIRLAKSLKGEMGLQEIIQKADALKNLYKQSK